MTLVRTLWTNCESVPTAATPSSAVCHTSCSSVSATEMLNLLESVSFRLLRTRRLSFRLCDSRSTRRILRVPTIIRLRLLTAARLVELPGDLLDRKGLDHVPDAYVVVARDLDAALVAFRDLLDVVLEALQGPDLARVDDLAVADQAHLAGALDLALRHDAAGDGADAGDA